MLKLTHDGERKQFGSLRELYLWMVENAEKVVVTRADLPDVLTHELINSTIEFHGQNRLVVDGGRKFNIGLALLEFATLFDGENEVKDYELYSPNFGKFTPDGKWFTGHYGIRVQHYIEEVVGKLQRHPQTRQAVLQVYSNQDLIGHWKDVRCALTVQFLIRGEELQMIVNMRSNDAFLGFVTDQFMFTMLQEYVARRVGTRVGKVYWNAASFHLYDYHVKKIDRLDGTPNRRMSVMPDEVTAEQVIEFSKAIRNQPHEELSLYFQELKECALICQGKKGFPADTNLRDWKSAFERDTKGLWS